MTLEQKLLIFLIVFLTIVGGIIALAVSLSVRNANYRRFVKEHSIALKRLEAINSSYQFKKIKFIDYRHSYDNESYYYTISTRDYLIYQLSKSYKDVVQSIKDARENKEKAEEYRKEVVEQCQLGSFDTAELLPNKKKLLKTETRLFNHTKKEPITGYYIFVCLTLTDINGTRRRSKSDRFYSSEILEIINGINNRSGDFYNDPEIWNAICRVERGKVSNKMRFAIYQRDGHRCRKCGRMTKDLEIDHIVPISKGGKTTYDNLQTLCHRCNKEKGAKTEYYSNKSRRFW